VFAGQTLPPGIPEAVENRTVSLSFYGSQNSYETGRRKKPAGLSNRGGGWPQPARWQVYRGIGHIFTAQKGRQFQPRSGARQVLAQQRGATQRDGGQFY